MRFFWKALLILIPLGGYWLYKKGNPPGDTEDQPEKELTSESPPGKSAEAKQDGMGPKRPTNRSENTKEKNNEASTGQAVERLSQIDGVTSRVAENLIEKGIYSKEALTALSRDELMDIKGIGPKRAEKILSF